MTAILTVAELDYIGALLRTFNRDIDLEVFGVDAKLIDPNGEVAGYIVYDPTVCAHTFVVEE